MKRILSIIIAVAALCACTEKQPGYVVKGQAGDLSGRAVLTYETPEGRSVSDTVAMKGGAFTFKGAVTDVVTAGVTLIPDGGEPLQARFPDAEAALYMFDAYGSQTSTEEFESGYNKFTEKVRNSFLGQGAREELASRKATQPGAEAPDFTLNDPDGNPVTLSSLRGQYVIVDFWASWCKPCRTGVPDMKKLYAKYHPKGLEIIGVSDDNNHDAWKKAIEQDQTPWIHVVDEFPVENKPARVGTLWGVHYIPSYFLLDKEGKIIGKMEHEELAAKLAELLD